MKIIRTGHRETRTVTLDVEGLPDLKALHSTVVVIPQQIDIRYDWTDPQYRNGWYRPGRSDVRVHGFRRLKAGGVGDLVHTVDMHHAWADQRPEWLAQIVADNMPTGWDV